MKMRDRPNGMTRNPEKQIIELNKLMRSDMRISTPTNGSTSDKRHDVIKRRGLSVRYTGLYTKGIPRAEATTAGVMTYSLALIQLHTH